MYNVQVKKKIDLKLYSGEGFFIRLNCKVNLEKDINLFVFPDLSKSGLQEGWSLS